MDKKVLNEKLIFDHYYNQPGLYYGNEVRLEFEQFIKKLNCREYIALELGCGEGRYSLFLSNFVKSVTSIDCSSVGINKLQNIAVKKSLNIISLCEDINTSKFSNNKYDIVIMATLLDHLDCLEQRNLMAKVFNSMKSGGIVYANVFTTEDPGFKKNNAKVSKEVDNISETSFAIRHYFKPSELKNLFSKFDILEYNEFIEKDISHGPVHSHGWAYIIARKWAKGSL